MVITTAVGVSVIDIYSRVTVIGCICSLVLVVLVMFTNPDVISKGDFSTPPELF